MDHIYKLIFVILIALSTQSFADTYPAQPYTAEMQCSDYGGISAGYNADQWSGLKCTKAGFPNSFMFDQLSCPSGGSLSGTSCLNAPPCDAGIVRDPSTGQCPAEPPVVCQYPEARDALLNVCAMPECTPTTEWNYQTEQCETPPVCASSEAYNAYTFQCELKKLHCPIHSHANTANDVCLPDPPLGCPVGLHDDGTYTCVADDAVGCRSDQVKGYINGIPQCIAKTNHDEATAELLRQKQLEATAQAEYESAQSAAAVAAAALAADPTNTSLQATSDLAAAAAIDKQTALSTAVNNAELAQQDSDTASLKSIAQSTKELADRDADDRAKGMGDIPTADTIGITDLQLTSIASGSSFGACPASYNITTHHGMVTMSYQPMCDFAQKISPLVLALSFLSAGLIVLGPIREG